MARTVRLTLPVPPSANRYWRTRIVRPKGRGKPYVLTYVSAEAVAFKADVSALALAQGIRRVAFPSGVPVAVTLVWFRERRSGDLSNRVKCLEDALNGVVWADDAQVEELHVYRVDGHGPARVEVIVTTAAEGWRVITDHLGIAE